MNLKKIQSIHSRLPGSGCLLDGLKLLRGYNPLPPMFVELLLTYRCNMNCAFCYQDREKRKTFPDLSLEDARAIEANLKHSFKLRPRIHLFGGEPTVNKDFLSILKLFSEKGYRVSITSNGVELDKYLKDLKLLENLIEINLSLNSLEFEKHISNIANLKMSRQKIKTKISLNCPVNTANQYSLTDIVRRFENSGADCIVFQHTTFTENYKKELDFDRIKYQIMEIKRNSSIPVLFNPDIKLRDIKEYYSNAAFPGSKKCIFSWFVLFIQPNGDVIPCDELGLVIGNVKNSLLKEIWNNTKLKQFRHGILKQGVGQPICKRCCHRQYY